MEFRTLRMEELAHWLDHCTEVFGDDREYFARHYRNDPQSHIEDIFVAVDGGKIAATVRVFRRKVYIGGQAVRMGGIGEVSTKTGYRRQGLSGKLLEMAIEHMKVLDMPVSMLFTGRHGHYAKYGWFLQRGEAVTVKISARGDLPEGYRVRRAEIGDIPALRGIYDLFAPRFNGTVVRDDPAYWDKWIWDEARAHDVFALIHEDAACAYLVVTKPWTHEGQPLFSVKEFAAAPDAEGLLPVFLSCTAKELNLPESARMAGPLWTFGGEVNRMPNDDMMLRLNRPFTLDEPIDSDEKLAEAFAGPLLFELVGF